MGLIIIEASHDTLMRLRGRHQRALDALAALVLATRNVLDVGPAYDDAQRLLEEEERRA